MPATYTTAPATAMLATHCAVCGRPLVDAQSVETGIGPICRARYLTVDALSDDARREANTLVYRIAAALSADAADTISQDLVRLTELGATTIVERILSHRAGVSAITILTPTDCPYFAVRAPRSDRALTAMRQIPGRQFAPRDRPWFGLHGVNVFPRAQWPAVLGMLRAAFGDGAIVRTVDGTLVGLSADTQPGFLSAIDHLAATGPRVTLSTPASRVNHFAGGALTTDYHRVEVAMPYSDAAVIELRAIPSRRWDRDQRTNNVLNTDLPAVLALVARHWPDAVVHDQRVGSSVHVGVPIGAFAAVLPAPHRVADQPAPAPAQDFNTMPLPDGRARAQATPTWLDRGRTASDDAPAIEYTGSQDHAVWLAETLFAVLQSAGFDRVHVPGTREAVYGIALENGAQVLVYTSAVAGTMRTTGADAIRVALVRDGRGIASSTRVNRAGTMQAIVKRVVDRCAEVSN